VSHDGHKAKHYHTVSSVSVGLFKCSLWPVPIRFRNRRRRRAALPVHYQDPQKEEQWRTYGESISKPSTMLETKYQRTRE